MDTNNLYIPECLNTDEKWHLCISNTNSMDKYEKLILKLSEDNQMTPTNFYLLIKALCKDLQSYHKNDAFIIVLNLLEALILYHCQFKEKNTYK